MISSRTRRRSAGLTFLASPNRVFTSRCCFFSSSVAFMGPPQVCRRPAAVANMSRTTRTRIGRAMGRRVEAGVWVFLSNCVTNRSNGASAPTNVGISPPALDDLSCGQRWHVSRDPTATAERGSFYIAERAFRRCAQLLRTGKSRTTFERQLDPMRTATTPPCPRWQVVGQSRPCYAARVMRAPERVHVGVAAGRARMDAATLGGIGS